MRGSTHLIGGVLVGVLVGATHGAMVGATHASPVQVLAIPLIVAGLAALAPDWFQFNLPGGNRVAHGVFGHRGLSHWLITALAVGLAVSLIAPGLALYALMGWISHIILDVISNGAPALWPLPWRVNLAHIKSGGRLDRLIAAALLVLTVVLLLRQPIGLPTWGIGHERPFFNRPGANRARLGHQPGNATCRKSAAH